MGEKYGKRGEVLRMREKKERVYVRDWIRFDRNLDWMGLRNIKIVEQPVHFRRRGSDMYYIVLSVKYNTKERGD